MKIEKISVGIGLLFLTGSVYSGDTLPSGSTLSGGQYIESTRKGYMLPMQSDGSLVMYRSDGSIRYRMAKHGRYATMRPDGNFVQTTSGLSIIWETKTYSPGARLTIQDDGNLVVYTPSGAPVWNIGADIGYTNPSEIGDVVGRDLATAGAGPAGHVGMGRFASN